MLHAPLAPLSLHPPEKHAGLHKRYRRSHITVTNLNFAEGVPAGHTGGLCVFVLRASKRLAAGPLTCHQAPRHDWRSHCADYTPAKLQARAPQCFLQCRPTSHTIRCCPAGLVSRSYKTVKNDMIMNIMMNNASV